MQQVSVRHSFKHSAQKVWKLAGDFGGLHNWLPGVERCEVTGQGARQDGGDAVRHVYLQDGSVAKESLETLDEAGMAYRYGIIEAKGFDGNNEYVALFQVTPLADEQCEVLWQANFTVPDGLPADKLEKLRQRVQTMYGFFLSHLETVLA